MRGYYGEGTLDEGTPSDKVTSYNRVIYLPHVK